MARRQRECYLCGTRYQYCPTCSEDRAKPIWLLEFHTENCKNIFEICTRYNMGLISKAEAQNALIECDLSNQSKFQSYVQHDLEVIFEETETEEVTVNEDPVDVTPIRNNANKHTNEVVKKENSKAL